MAFLLHHNIACWRCEATDVHVFECDGQLYSGSFATFVCRPCIEELVEVRHSVNSLRARGRRPRISERNAFMIDVVTVRCQDSEPLQLHFDTDLLDEWAGGPYLEPYCGFCATTPGYHVYRCFGDRYPIFTACRTCLRHTLIANCDPVNPRRLFEYVLRVTEDGRLLRLAWRSRALIAFLAQDAPWAEAMGRDF